MSGVRLEICLENAESALAAEQNGASRVELCGNLLEGGTTPSYGLITICKKILSIPIHVMIRPRGGDFCYSDMEYEIMKEDIKTCKLLGVEGVVLGLLLPDGSVDVSRTKILADLAKPMSVTFHRAFDMTNDPKQALEDIIVLKIS